MKPKTIVLTGGGSGGHITPLLSVAHELKKADPSVSLAYIGHSGDNFDSLKLPTSDFDFTAFINAGKFRRYHGKSLISHFLDVKTIALNARDLFRLLGSTAKSIKILRRLRPQLVFSKGGFVAVPVGLAARLLRVPIVTHDSDAVPGLANKIVSRWAKWHATGMPAEFYNYPRQKIVYTGIPLPPGVGLVTPQIQAKAKRDLGFKANNTVLLIGGAGNGSATLNSLMVAIAPRLFKAFTDLRIVHVAGQRNEANVRDLYKATLGRETAAKVRIFGFTPDFSSCSAAADLIVSRAGATALAEFAAQAKACVIVPAAFLTAGQQAKNAEQLTATDAAAVLNEPVDSDEMLAVVSELINDPERRSRLAANLHRSAKLDATKAVTKLLLDTLNTGVL